MKKLIVIVIVLAALGSGAWAYYNNRNRPDPQVTTMPVTRGDVAETVQATGTLEAVTTVDVGTQVSGVVQDLYTDFNKFVKKGQVIARLDPSILETQIQSQQANVIRAEADLERLRVGLQDAKQKLDRANAMFARQLIPKTDLETAEINVKSADAQIKSSEASLTQSKAALNQAQVNLGYTIIRSPIDGIVIQRSVDPGQTVAASMNAPTLYVIAADLSKMQVLANIDESEIGKMRPGQLVTFRVDAYPNEQFHGEVDQVRLQPTVVQNVVVYSTVIAVPNPQLKLKPGMTANVVVEVAKRPDVLRVPMAALRFRPTELMFQVLNQEMPPEARGRGGFGGGAGGRGGRRGDGTGAPGAGATPGGAAAPSGAAPSGGAAPSSAAPSGAKPAEAKPVAPQSAQAKPQAPAPAPSSPPSAEARGGGDRAEGNAGGGRRGGFDPNMTPEERRKRMEERMAAMSPEERAQFEERMRQRGLGRGGNQGGGPGGGFGGGRDGNQNAGTQAGGRGAGSGRGTQANAAPGAPAVRPGRDLSRGIVGGTVAGPAVASGHDTIDSLFAPIQIPEVNGRVWIYVDKQLKPVRVKTALTDGTFAEVVEGDVKEGQEVVVNMVTGLEQRTSTGTPTTNPLMGPQRGGPGGGNRGGGGGRGF